MTEQKRFELAEGDPLSLGDELLATSQQRPLAVDELIEWLRALLAIAGDPQQLQKNADQASGVIWALYLTWRISAAELAANLGKLSPSEFEGFRIGAVSAIVNKMGNDPSKMADMTKYLRSQEMRAKVMAMLPDDAARQRWGEMLDFEVGVSSTAARSLGNSATARRAAEMADADSVSGDLVLSALAGTPVGGAVLAVRQQGRPWSAR